MSADDNDDGEVSVVEMYRNLDEDFNIFYHEEDGKLVTYVDEELRLTTLSMIEGFVDAIDFSDDAGFVKEVNPMGETDIKVQQLGQHFERFNGYLNARSDYYLFSEKVKLFYAACKLYDMAAEDFRFLKRPSIVNDSQMLWERSNAFIDYIRKECRSRPFKKRLYDRNYQARGNYDSCMKYVNCLFEAKSRYLVLRVDLGYLKACHTEVDLSRVRADMERLLNNRRSNKLFKSMEGYIWKLEYGARKGYHYHCIFFFDGATVEKDSYYADMIGQYWVNKITRGAGTMFNCNAQKNKYKHCGIGMINRTDLEKREFLLRYPIEYLTKKEQYLAMKLSKKPKLFGRGKMPVLLDQKLGRPRKD